MPSQMVMSRSRASALAASSTIFLCGRFAVATTWLTDACRDGTGSTIEGRLDSSPCSILLARTVVMAVMAVVVAL